MEYILSYDLGTGGTKASLYDRDGKSAAFAFVPCKTYYPSADFREQKPEEWMESIYASTGELLRKSAIDAGDIQAISLSGHSLGVVPIGKGGELLTEFTPIWSDARAVKQAEEFFRRTDYKEWYTVTGGGFPAHLYSVFKILWYRDNFPDIYNKTACFLGTKDYINFLLTGVAATDYSYASGSGVYDLKHRKYHEEYIRLAGIERGMLPEIIPSTQVVGTLLPDMAKKLGLPAGIRVVCGGVDNACMALGAGCMGEGESYLSLGTSAWIAVSGGEPILNPEKKTYVFAHCVPNMFVSSTAIFSAGNSYRWIRDTLCGEFARRQEEGGENAYDAMERMAEHSPPGSRGLLFNPSLAGGSEIDETPNVRGSFIGLDLGHTRDDMIRAGLEGICLNLRVALDVLAERTPLSESMPMVGGGGKSLFWRSLFADIFEKTIVQTQVGEDAGAFGAAALGAVGCGLWKDFSPVKGMNRAIAEIPPDRDRTDVYRRIYPVFREMMRQQYVIGDRIAELRAVV